MATQSQANFVSVAQPWLWGGSRYARGRWSLQHATVAVRCRLAVTSLAIPLLPISLVATTRPFRLANQRRKWVRRSSAFTFVHSLKFGSPACYGNQGVGGPKSAPVASIESNTDSIEEGWPAAADAAMAMPRSESPSYRGDRPLFDLSGRRMTSVAHT